MDNKVLALIFIFIAVILDVLANICIKKSNSMGKKKYIGLAGIFIISFCLMLVKAIDLMDLSIVYAMFGALGLIATTVVDKLLFDLKIESTGVLGIASVISGVVIMQLL